MLMALLIAGIVFLLAAFPAGLAAERFGRLRVIVAGMALFVTTQPAGTPPSNPVERNCACAVLPSRTSARPASSVVFGSTAEIIDQAS